MTTFDTYHWPTKLKKFGITDPFLKILATKYEKEIPWQITVRDAETLRHFVKHQLLPDLLAKLLPPSSTSDRAYFYIAASDVDLPAFLEADIHRNNPDLQAIWQIWAAEGDSRATECLVQYLNQVKYHAFKAWLDLLEKQYPNEQAFHYLLLKPLFEFSDKGMRRPLPAPSASVIEWLLQRIASGRLLPDENIARQYFLKLGLGNDSGSSDGWQYIPAGLNNAVQLSAVCAGSGWCVAQRTYAEHYLFENEFYILRLKGKPVVALRVTVHDQKIVESRGRYNKYPADYDDEIDLFINTQKFTDYVHFCLEVECSRIDYFEQPLTWWQHHLAIWPFAIALAPSSIKEDLMPQAVVDAYKYPHFRYFELMAGHIGLTLDETSWALMIEDNPHRLADCPARFKTLPKIRQACLMGWIARTTSDQLNSAEFEVIPDFVRNDPAFQTILQENLPSPIRQTIRKNPKKYAERENRFNLQEVLPEIANESVDLVIERMVNIILNNQDGNYADRKFSLAQRQREDFPVLRSCAWYEAYNVHPPLWFALPEDLKGLEQFRYTEKVAAKFNIDDWRAKVTQKPWLLTQQKGVPKSLRHHPDILHAYRDGWLPNLRKSPWRIWLPKGARRIYMSYALLEDKQVLNALTEGWLNQKTKFMSSWFSKPSERMRNIPAIQLSAMWAVMQIKSFTRLAVKDGDTLNLCADIFMRLKAYRQQNLPETRLHREIKILLGNKGVR
jgi:hypothetical protein